MATIVDLLRHGEPEGGRMYRGGGTDHPLSEVGWTQMYESIEKNQTDWSAIISSPMLRCQAFAQQLAESRQIPLQIVESFREAGYGDWEGLTPDQIRARSETEYFQFFADPVNKRPPNAESLEAFTIRINNAFIQLLAKYQGQHILLISHLGVTRAIIDIILGMPTASQQLIGLPYAGMLQVIDDSKGLRLVMKS